MFLPRALYNKDAILWGASMTGRQRARIQTARDRFLAQFSLCVHKGGINPIHFIFIFCHFRIEVEIPALNKKPKQTI